MDESGGVGTVGFAEYVLSVGVHGLLGDGEGVGNGFAAFAFYEEGEDLLLAGGDELWGEGEFFMDTDVDVGGFAIHADEREEGCAFLLDVGDIGMDDEGADDVVLAIELDGDGLLEDTDVVAIFFADAVVVAHFVVGYLGGAEGSEEFAHFVFECEKPGLIFGVDIADEEGDVYFFGTVAEDGGDLGTDEVEGGGADVEYHVIPVADLKDAEECFMHIELELKGFNFVLAGNLFPDLACFDEYGWLHARLR